MKSRYLSIFILWLLLITLPSWANDNLDLGTPSRDGQLVDRTGYAFLYSERLETLGAVFYNRIVNIWIAGYCD